MSRLMSLPRIVGMLLLFTLMQVGAPANAAELPDFTSLVKKVEPAVVNISSTETKSVQKPWQGNMPNVPPNSPFYQFFKHFFGNQPNGPQPQEKIHSLGSGFLISSDGYILTNRHVVKGATKIIVQLNDGKQMPAKLIGMDKATDLAVLKIKGDHYPKVTIGDSDKLQVGQWVLAIGEPFGLEHTATQGIVSALGRNLPHQNYVPFIQTDVAVNPGNSGGPLFNLNGEVVGINSEIYSNTGGFMGLSFAIPINVAMNVAKQIKATGHASHGYLGVVIQPVTQDLAKTFGLSQPTGALISKVMPDSAAAKAGLRAGDIILEYNGEKVDSSASLPPMVGSTPAGKTVPVKILRNGHEQTVQVTVGELSSEQEAEASGGGSSSGPSEAHLNLEVSPMTAAQRKQHGTGDRGLLVDNVGKGPAQEAGVHPGDILLALDNHDLKTVAELRHVVKEMPKGKPVPLLIQRGDSPLFLAITVPKK